jgi:hypothetical protein
LLLKRAQCVLGWVCLCIGQDWSPVSSQHREEVQSPISSARFVVMAGQENLNEAVNVGSRAELWML